MEIAYQSPDPSSWTDEEWEEANRIKWYEWLWLGPWNVVFYICTFSAGFLLVSFMLLIIPCWVLPALYLNVKDTLLASYMTRQQKTSDIFAWLTLTFASLLLWTVLLCVIGDELNDRSISRVLQTFSTPKTR